MDTTTTGKIITANVETAKVMNGGSVVWSGQINPTIVPDSYIISADKTSAAKENNYGNATICYFTLTKNVDKLILNSNGKAYVLVDTKSFVEKLKDKKGKIFTMVVWIDGGITNGLTVTSTVEYYSDTNFVSKQNGDLDSNASDANISAFLSPQDMLDSRYALVIFSEPIILKNVNQIGITVGIQ